MPHSLTLAAASRALIMALVCVAGCGDAAEDLLCAEPGCEFSAVEWKRLRSLSVSPPGTPARLRGLGLPPLDPSNRLAAQPLFVGDGETLPPGAALGKQLYFDSRFSGGPTHLDILGRRVPWARFDGPGRISCATCHDPRKGGVDPAPGPGHVSVGAGWYDVNAQPTINAAYYRKMYWNGRNDSLWSQIIAVSESRVSMNGHRLAIAQALARLYAREYQAVFAHSLAPIAALPAIAEGVAPAAAFQALSEAMQGEVTTVFVNWAKAIAAYEQLLVRADSAFDRFVEEGPRSAAIEPSAKRGARLFVGKAACIDCHNGPLLSDDRFHNIGVPQRGEAVPTEADCGRGLGSCDCPAFPAAPCLPWGALDGRNKLNASPFRRSSRFSDDEAARGQPDTLPLDEKLKGAWRTPSLRDVTLTAPYMHDGLYGTLEEVIWHYDRGGTREASGRPAAQLRPLHLDEDERRDLVAFLATLAGAPLPAVLVSPPVLPP